MRVPQVSERLKEAPAQALRGVFAGIGQLLLITDKLRNKPRDTEDAPAADTAAEPAPAAAQTAPATQTAPPAEAAPAANAAPAAAAAEAEAEPAGDARDLDKTGNVRLLTEQDTGTEEPVEAQAPAAAAEVEAEAVTVPATAADLPLPNYDELSVASLRARLRTLTAAQVAELADYERAHAARPEVVTMFERRIAKLEAGG
jgi:hypothetical protein